ncbi:MAG: hypothetical protein ACK4K4_02585 [Caldimicrobium sp.]
MAGFCSFCGKALCSNPFSFLVGFGLGILGLYFIEKAKEGKHFEETTKEIEAMIKALEMKTQSQSQPQGA